MELRVRLIVVVLAAVLVGCGVKSPVSGTPYVVTDQVAYDPADHARVATIYAPIAPTSSLSPWLYGIHGGAFMQGSRYDLAVYAQEFCPLGYAVVSVDYNLTTSGHRWPAQLRDCQAGLRFFRERATQFGLDPDHFAVIGGSAGGCLATHLGLEDDPAGPLGRAAHVVDNAGEQDLRLLDSCMFNDGLITALLLGHAAPWTEAELLGPSNVQRARADADFFVVHGSANGDVYVANADALVAALQGAGAQVEYHRVLGGGMWSMGEPAVDAALRAWLRGRLGR